MSSDEERTQDIPSEETEGEDTRRTPIQRVSQAVLGALGRQIRRGTQEEDTSLQRNLFEDPEGHQEPDVLLPGQDILEDPSLGEQEQETMASTSNATLANMPTVFGNATDMFLDADPLEEEKLAGGACQHPRSERERLKNDPKALDKIKKGCTAALELKFGLPNYLVSNKYTNKEEDDENGNGAATSEATDTIIGVGYR